VSSWSRCSSRLRRVEDEDSGEVDVSVWSRRPSRLHRVDDDDSAEVDLLSRSRRLTRSSRVVDEDSIEAEVSDAPIRSPTRWCLVVAWESVARALRMLRSRLNS
jgi:hypothetical protein